MGKHIIYLDFNNKLKIPLSAHSKIDPSTGDLIFFNANAKAPFMTYGVLSKSGDLHSTPIDLPGPRLPHDISVTKNFSVLHDFPLVYNSERFFKSGIRVPLFTPNLATRFGVIPRFGTNEDVKWFECKPCYMLHVVNAYEEGDEIVQIGCRTDDPSLKPNPKDGELAGLMAYLTLQANLYEWRFNLKTGEVKERHLCKKNAEFPTINREYIGTKQRYAYLQDIREEAPPTFDALLKYDLEDMSYSKYSYGKGIYGSEAFFAPKLDPRDEDDGYVITFTTDTNTWSSKCLILDAKDIEKGPICQIKIPQRLPAGFHALWVPGQEFLG